MFIASNDDHFVVMDHYQIKNACLDRIDIYWA